MRDRPAAGRDDAHIHARDGPGPSGRRAHGQRARCRRGRPDRPERPSSRTLIAGRRDDQRAEAGSGAHGLGLRGVLESRVRRVHGDERDRKRIRRVAVGVRIDRALQAGEQAVGRRGLGRAATAGVALAVSDPDRKDPLRARERLREHARHDRSVPVARAAAREVGSVAYAPARRGRATIDARVQQRDRRLAGPARPAGWDLGPRARRRAAAGNRAVEAPDGFDAQSERLHLRRVGGPDRRGEAVPDPRVLDNAIQPHALGAQRAEERPHLAVQARNVVALRSGIEMRYSHAVAERGTSQLDEHARRLSGRDARAASVVRDRIDGDRRARFPASRGGSRCRDQRRDRRSEASRSRAKRPARRRRAQGSRGRRSAP